MLTPEQVAALRNVVPPVPNRETILALCDTVDALWLENHQLAEYVDGDAVREMETLRGIAKRIADGCMPSRDPIDGTLRWHRYGDLGDREGALSPAEVEAIYGKEQSHDGK